MKATKLSARLNRMRYIDRWPLMNCLQREDVAQHIYETNTIAIILAFIDKNVFGNTNTDPYKTLAISQMHEAEECLLTGDMNTVVKNVTPRFAAAYKELKEGTLDVLIEDVPEALKEEINSLVRPDDCREKELAKYADIIQAHIKAKIEVIDGNGREFQDPRDNTEAKVLEISKNDKTVSHFVDNYLPAHFYSVDKLLVNKIK